MGHYFPVMECLFPLLASLMGHWHPTRMGGIAPSALFHPMMQMRPEKYTWGSPPLGPHLLGESNPQANPGWCNPGAGIGHLVPSNISLSVSTGMARRLTRAGPSKLGSPSFLPLPTAGTISATAQT